MYKNSRIIYLSGTMEGRPYSAVKKQRDKAIKKLTDAGFTVCDPLRLKEKHFRGGSQKMNLAKADYDIQQVIGRDENDIRASDGLLVLTGDRPSSGTWFEFSLAVNELHIPVVVIAPKLRKRMDEKGGAFEWTSGKATKVVRDITEAIEILQWLFGQRYISPHSSVKDISKTNKRLKNKYTEEKE